MAENLHEYCPPVHDACDCGKAWQEGRDSAALKWLPIPDEAPANGRYLLSLDGEITTVDISDMQVSGVNYITNWRHWCLSAGEHWRIAGPIESPKGE